MNKYIPASGNLGAKLVIITDSPSYEEHEQSRRFVGAWANEFDRIARDAGIRRENCWLTSVSKYLIPAPPKGKKTTFSQRCTDVGVDFEEQLKDLRNELNTIQPNCILALGQTALWAITGKSPIADYRGSILLGMGHKVVGTYHPKSLLYKSDSGSEFRGYWNRQVMVFDFKRALAQSAFKSIIRPVRSLNICQNSAQLYDFIQRHRDYEYPSIDIEASSGGSCIPICIGISFRPNEGTTVPLWNVEGISTIPDSDLASIWRLLADFLYNHGIVGQNFGYDRDKIKRLGFIIKFLKSDTMLKAFCINPELPKNLAFNTSIYTEEPFYKNEGMYEGSTIDLFTGCARDACVTKEIDLAQDKDLDEMGLRKYYENFVLQLHDLYAYIESEGLRTNETIRENLIRKYVEWDERIRFELFGITGSHINTSSPKQIASLLFDNWKLPLRKGTGEEEITKLLQSPKVSEPQRRGMELILEDRRVKKTLSSYLLSPTDFDGRMRTSYFICLDTGRSSSNQQEPPIRPSIEIREDGKKKKKSLGMAFQTITKHGDIGPEVRTMFIPDEGEIYLQADSSQAEARVVFLLAEDYQALEDIDKHDYHALTASWFFGGTESDYSKKVLGYEHPIRFAGKTLRHAGHLGAGKSRAATELNTQARKYHIDISISEGTADTALKIFHKKQPKIKEVFQASVIKCLEKNRQLTAPVPYGIDAPKGGTRIFFERWNDELFRQAFSYIPQRTVSENIKAAALRIRKYHFWIRILAESHDALLTSVPIHRKQEAAKILRQELSRPIDFSRCSIQRGELVIPCDVEEGMDFYKFTKFKFLTEVSNG